MSFVCWKLTGENPECLFYTSCLTQHFADATSECIGFRSFFRYFFFLTSVWCEKPWERPTRWQIVLLSYYEDVVNLDCWFVFISSYSYLLLLLLLQKMNSVANTVEGGLSYLRRHLGDAALSEEDGSSDGSFDPKVFWSVNALIFCIVVGSCAWFCCFGGREMLLLQGANRINSDETYRQAVLEREQRKIEAKRDSLGKRRKRLLQSFQRHSVSMVSLHIPSQRKVPIGLRSALPFGRCRKFDCRQQKL